MDKYFKIIIESWRGAFLLVGRVIKFKEKVYDYKFGEGIYLQSVLVDEYLDNSEIFILYSKKKLLYWHGRLFKVISSQEISFQEVMAMLI